MPYRWTETAPDTSGAFLQTVILWPHRSLPKRGFVWFIGITAVLLLLPILAVLGTQVLWGLLPFMALTVGGVWIALRQTYRTGQTREELVMDRTHLQIRRNDPGRPERLWQTNSYWVRPGLRNGPVEAYLTLSDGQREIELGAFLTPDERRTLCDELMRRLARLR
ncbi:DUF2244 domain-containing protein [Paracoccus sp. PAMC 22219]|uniref:DUF2244 domain-containing protein n=1 Tax=Paracoccus sp. PAMC 22219 TaxID=1569209 RepID=UPI0005A66481|nr:DUF2244 domain-containing protein [Paracoccus sp. PAMC 22219]